MIFKLMEWIDMTLTQDCLFFSAETGEKTEKECESKEEVEPEKPKKSAAKKEKKLKKDGGFQIWTELETQRNKFMVVFVSKVILLCNFNISIKWLISWRIFICLL